MSALLPWNWGSSKTPATTGTKAPGEKDSTPVKGPTAPGGVGETKSTISSATTDKTSVDLAFYKRAWAYTQTTRAYGWAEWAVVGLWNLGCRFVMAIYHTVVPPKPTQKKDDAAANTGPTYGPTGAPSTPPTASKSGALSSSTGGMTPKGSGTPATDGKKK